MKGWINSFRIRLTLLFAALSIVVGGITLLSFDRAASTRLTEENGESLRDTARFIAGSLAASLRERDREMTLLAQSPFFAQGDLRGPEVRQQIEQAKRTYPYYAWIGVADAEGVVQSASSALLEGDNVAERPWFREGTRGPYIGDLHEAKLLAKHLVSEDKEPLRFVDFAAPIRDKSGNLRGVLASHALWSWAADIVRNTLRREKLQEGVQAFIVNKNGQTLYPYDAENEVSPAALAQTSDAYSILNWRPDEAFLTTSVVVQSGTATDLGWRVVLRQPLGKALAPVAQLHQILILLIFFSIACFMVLAYRLATEFSRPIEQLAEAAHRIQQGDEQTKFPLMGRTHEIVRLTESMRTMANTLIARRQALELSNAQLEMKVAERTSELSDLYNNSPVGYHTLSPDGTILQINDRELSWLGYERDEIVGKANIRELLHSDYDAAFRERYARIKSGISLPPADFQLVRKDGSVIDVRVSTTAVFNEHGQFVVSRTAVMDITEQRGLEVELRRQETLNRTIIHATANGLVLYDHDGRCVLANEAAAEIVGSSVQGLLEQNFHEIPSWRQSGLYESALRCLAGQQNQSVAHFTSSFGKQVDCLTNFVPMWHEGKPMALLVIKDVSELMSAQRELEKLARHDALTGIHNRLAANEKLREEFLRMKRTGVAYSVLIMDVDHFKRVNDTYGHETGDQALRHVACTLLGVARNTDFVARFGGEEFLLILPDTDQKGASVLAEKVRAAIAGAPLPLVGHLTLSIGLSAVSFEDFNEDAAVRRADQALYRAKHNGRNRVEEAVPLTAEEVSNMADEH